MEFSHKNKWDTVGSVAMSRVNAIGLVALGFVNAVGMAAVSVLNPLGLVVLGRENAIGLVAIGGVNAVGFVAVGGPNAVGIVAISANSARGWPSAGTVALTASRRFRNRRRPLTGRALPLGEPRRTGGGRERTRTSTSSMLTGS